MRNSEMKIDVIQILSGHKNVQSILNYYSSLTEDQQRKYSEIQKF